MEKQANDEIEIDFLEILRVIRFRAVLIIIVGIITATIAGIGTGFLIEPKYEATTKLYIVSQSSTITSLTDLQVGTQLTQDYMVLIESRPVLEKVIENLGLDIEYESLLEMMSLNNPTDTRILEITIKDTDPYMAKEIVDEIATVSIARIGSIMNVEQPTIVEAGHLSKTPSSPNLKKNVLIGALIGLLAAVGVVCVMYIMDDTVTTSEDIEKYLGLNTLGIIPVEEGAVEKMMKDKRKRKRSGRKVTKQKKKRAGKKTAE